MCGNASIWAKIAFPVILLALILDIVGFATIAWMVYSSGTTEAKVGLWQQEVCVSDACTQSEVAESLQNDTFVVAQVFAIITFILIVLGTITIGVYIFVNALRTSTLAMAAMILCLAASVSAFVCMICWLVYIPDPYTVSYSMGLTVIAGILALIAGLLMVPDVLEARSYPGNRARVDSPPNRRFMFKQPGMY